MYNVNVSKVVDKKMKDKEIERLVGDIALELGIGAFGMNKIRIAWESNGKIQWHDAINISWSQNEPFMDIRVFAYALNKAFPGAQACINNPGLGKYYTGHVKHNDADEEE